jgi:hypothetical protein
MAICPKCNEKLRHMHNTAYGMAGTHMAGTERYECSCGFYCGNAYDGRKLNLSFVYDDLSDEDYEGYLDEEEWEEGGKSNEQKR